MIRYLLIATHVPASGAGGGMIRYTVELARALAVHPEVELHVLATPEGGEFFRTVVAAERVHEIRALPVAVRSIAERYGSAVPKVPGGFDVVHGPKHLVPRRSRGARRVVTVHDMLPLDRPGDFGLVKRVLLRRPYLASIDDSDVVLSVSRATRQRMLDYRPSAAARTAVVPLAVSAAFADLEPAPVPQLAGRAFALVVGDSSERKNLALVVDTWAEATREQPDAVLAVVGPPDWGSSHRGSSWAELVAAGRIVPLGHVADAELAWCYREAVVVLCPSLLEGFGLPTIEAATHGGTVLTSDDPALVEACGGAAEHVPAWDPAAWTAAVAAGLAGELPAQAVPVGRTWSEVAADTLAALTRIPGAGAGPDPRIGVSPFAAPLRIAHVVGDDGPLTPQEIDAAADAHRERGWKVDVLRGAAGPAGPAAYDVELVHGLSRAADPALAPARVLVAGVLPVRGLRAAQRAAAAANVVLVEPAQAERWARWTSATLATLPVGDPAEALAALAARARAFGGRPRPQV